MAWAPVSRLSGPPGVLNLVTGRFIPVPIRRDRLCSIPRAHQVARGLAAQLNGEAPGLPLATRPRRSWRRMLRRS